MKNLVTGDTHHDNPDPGSAPVKIGGKAATSLPTAVASGDRVDAYFDENGRLHIVADSSESRGDVLDLAPPLDAGVAYASGDVLFIPVLFGHIARANGLAAALHSVLVVDVDGNAGALDLFFLRTVQNVGAINDALALSDAEAVELLGWIEIVAADYKDHGDQKAVFKTPQSTGWNVGLLEPAVASQDIYVFGVSRDTKTYTASALKLKFNVLYL